MQLNASALPTILCSAFLFYLGSFLGKHAVSRVNRGWLLLAGVVLALPGLLFVLYYAHLFDNAALFYSFRALPFTELLGGGIGLLAGTLNSWFDPETLGEKLVAPATLLLLVLIPFVKPLLDPIDLSHLRD